MREGIGRWTLPISVAYLLWRYSFAFPNLGLFTFLAVINGVGEGIGLAIPAAVVVPCTIC